MTAHATAQDRRAAAPTPAEAADADDLARSLRAAGLDVRPLPTAEPTAEGLRAAIAARRGPAVLRGLAADWPARRAWSPNRLARTHGTKEVTALMDLPPAGTLFPREQGSYERAMPFADFLRRMVIADASAPCYLAYTPTAGLFSADDYDFAPYTGADQEGTDTRVWIGSAGTRSMLHSDLKDNLFCQLFGEKHVILLPWEHSRAAYPFPGNVVNSRLDLAELDVDRFPRLRDVPLYAGTMRPGDVLFMPRGCWHDIRSRTASVSLNHWFGPPLTARDYARLVLRCGPRFWAATVRDFLRHGLLGRKEGTHFFFSPPSTGKRLYDRLRFGDFSRDNDPVEDS